MTVIKRGTARMDKGGAGATLGPYTAELLSDTGGLTQFGAFVETLPPGSASSHNHWHTTEDEMILMLSGTLTLIEDGTETTLVAGDAATWAAGTPVGHNLRNDSDADARYVLIGTRVAQDRVTYPTLDRVLIYDRANDIRRYETLDGQPSTKPE
ncbi:cupin domain-containing protein [uncultured Tateyamaria sp.]|uniref:cupin domain-containing protein n=1 Tax=uncultured Tateyamaria sp. TaxID=455651 RepID=UPI00260BE3BA|nr:cupin domain-containing protein [uncultured Tateyamaria sp.]